jgi:hypothetical protein
MIAANLDARDRLDDNRTVQIWNKDSTSLITGKRFHVRLYYAWSAESEWGTRLQEFQAETMYLHEYKRVGNTKQEYGCFLSECNKE